LRPQARETPVSKGARLQFNQKIRRKREKNSFARPFHPAPVTLNRRLRDPGRSLLRRAGLSSPACAPDRDACRQLRRMNGPRFPERVFGEEDGCRNEGTITRKWRKTMELKLIDPRSLQENPDRLRRAKSNPQSDALLLASITAVGIVQPPVVYPAPDGGNGFVINFGHRRVAQAIAAGHEHIEVIVTTKAEADHGMSALAENIVREPLNPVDQWRAIERLAALGWTEESIAMALASQVRQVKKLRLLANVLPAMLDQMAKGDMPNESQLRTIAAAAQGEQAEIWKRFKPKKASPQVSWHQVAHALSKQRMEAKHASFGDDLAVAYGIVWQEDLFAPADEDGRYTNEVEAFFGAQREWLANNLPERGSLIDCDQWGQPKLPPKAVRAYGNPDPSHHAGLYLDERTGEVKSVAFRLPEARQAKVTANGEAIAGPSRVRPDVTVKGHEIIGDLRTDALHEALARAPIEDDVLLALTLISFASQNVSITSAAPNNYHSASTMARLIADLIKDDGTLILGRETLQQTARSLLRHVLSCQVNRTNSGFAARIAGQAVGADSFLPNMGTDEFLSCLSRSAMEGTAKSASVPVQQKVKDTRSALVKRFADTEFVHPSALFALRPEELAGWIGSKEQSWSGQDEGEFDVTDEASSTDGPDMPVEQSADEAEADGGNSDDEDVYEPYAVAAE
jgi:ParB family transcriptional regulator, chromosome partitioning protein